MNWRDLFNLEHEHVHTAKLDEPAEFQDLVLRGLTDEELRLVPVQGQNSVVWRLWHITRCKDVATKAVLSLDDAPPSRRGTVTRGSVYFDDTGAMGEAEVEVLVDSPVVLGVADGFIVDEVGRIGDQANHHFDRRDLTNLGWHTP
jgi:hypothetical protein